MVSTSAMDPTDRATLIHMDRTTCFLSSVVLTTDAGAFGPSAFAGTMRIPRATNWGMRFL